MTIARTDFIVAFPEFSDTAKFPAGQVSFWIGQGYDQLNAQRFGSQTDYAVMLFAAHNLVLSAQAAATVAAGGVPGGVSGLQASKSVGSVSVSYDTGSISVDGAGNYNATTYGQRLWRLMRAKGGAPVYSAPRRVMPF